MYYLSLRAAEPVFQCASSRDLRYLLIGGWAGKIYGTSRGTQDVDLLVQAELREAWHQLLEELSYQLVNVYREFSRFKSTTELPDVDLMFLGEESYLKMWAEKIPVAGSGLCVPRIEHLLALKVKGLRDQAYRRELGCVETLSHPHKTLRDIVELMRIKQAAQSIPTAQPRSRSSSLR